MVDELKQKALEQGVQIITKNKVISVEHHEGKVRHVLCGDGMKIEANHIILTTPPAVAHELVPHAEETALHTWKEQAVEVTAACLDVALRRLPEPKRVCVRPRSNRLSLESIPSGLPE